MGVALTAILVTALAGGGGWTVLAQGPADGGLRQDPGGVNDRYGQVAVLEDQGDLGAAGQDGLGPLPLQVPRRLVDEATRALQGLPVLDGVDRLHDGRILYHGIGPQGRTAPGLEVLFQKAE